MMTSFVSSTSLRVLSVLGMLVAGGLFSGPPCSGASLSVSQEGSVRADTSDHPNQQPYTTDRSWAYHVLAAPAYVLHGVTRPLGWTVRYMENRYPALFKGQLPVRGGVPLAEFGGPARFMGGVLLYDNALFGSEHEMQLEGLYGSANAFRGKGRYRWPEPLGDGTALNATVNVFANPRATFFLDGNESERSADRTVFAQRQMDATVGLGYRSGNGRFGGTMSLQYERANADEGDAPQGRRLLNADPPGLQPVQLLTPQLTVGMSRTNKQPRPSFGTELVLQLNYAHDLNGKRFRYGRYVAELRQYLPVLFFPPSRRLVLRGRLEQVEPLFGGEAVPFHQLPGLGGQTTLRGFRHTRFQDTGSLMVTAEYRYPIWSNLDAVAFVDAGQVFPELRAVAADRFHWSYGGGIHLLNSDGLGVRFELAGSTEGLRTILTVDSSFHRVPR